MVHAAKPPVLQKTIIDHEVILQRDNVQEHFIAANDEGDIHFEQQNILGF